jgi:ABC-2 type transport system permease protein
MAATAFWFTSARALSDLFWNAIRFVEYPINIYNAALVWILTYVVPFGFVSFYPSQYFFGNTQWLVYAYATPLVGLLSFAIAYFFWSYGLKNYASAGH